MSELRFSIVIPYRQRLANLRLAFESLAEQTFEHTEFEVVVGAMEYDPDYVALCREFSDRLDIVSVLSDRPWQVGRARNLALRQARGDVLLLMDADLLLPPNLLKTLDERHFGYRQRVCVVGQMIDYDNNTHDVETVQARPYEHYRKLLADLETVGEVREDPRLDAVHRIPWSFAWTALIALPAALVADHELLFDLDFQGYGVEDLEWAHRVATTGTPILMATDVYGIHLPHVRDVAANRRSETVNYRRFLRKWPGTDVELACAFGDFEANDRYQDFTERIREVTGSAATSLAVVKGEVDGVSTLVVGALVDAAGRLLDRRLTSGFDVAPEVLPLTGLALPWEDGSVARCRVRPALERFPAPYRDRMLAEVRRVTASVVLVDPGE